MPAATSKATPTLPPFCGVTTRLSRRNALGASAALFLIAASEAGASKASEIDGELLAACLAALAINDENDRLYDAAADDLPGTAAWTAYQRHLDDIYFGKAGQGPSFQEWLARICKLPARTPEGLAAKVAVCRAALPQDRENLMPSEILVWSVLDDMAGRVGV